MKYLMLPMLALLVAAQPALASKLKLTYTLQSPDGKTETTKDVPDNGSDFTMKGSDWRCFMVGPRAETDSIVMFLKCQSKVNKDISFMLPLIVKKGETSKSIDVTLLKKKNNYDYRVVVNFDAE